MPTITVMAPDSALAMDEVVRQLGDGAYILSTTQQDGMIQIKATNEPMTATPPRANLVKTVFEDEMERQFAGGLKAAAKPAVAVTIDAEPDIHTLAEAAARGDRPKLVAVNGGLTEGAASGGGAQGSDASAEAENTQTEDAKPTFRKTEFFDDPTAFRSHRSADARDAAPEAVTTTVEETPALAEEAMLETPADVLLEATNPFGTAALNAPTDFATRLRRLEQALGLPEMETTVPPAPEATEPERYEGADIVAAGMAPELVAEAVKHARLELENPSRSDVLSILAEDMVGDDPSLSLDADVLFVIGASGSGKTTLAAKFAALLRETREDRDISLISLEDAMTPQIGWLGHLGRLINVPCAHWRIDAPAQWQSPRQGQSLVVDLACGMDAFVAQWPTIQAQFEGKRCHVVLALSSGQSSARIAQSLRATQDVRPEVVLTKLDECECTITELSQIVAQEAQIGWLAGTRALVGNLAQATAPIMEQYLQGCMTPGEDAGPDSSMEPEQ